MTRPVVTARLRTPWATPGGIRRSFEAPLPSVTRMRTVSVRDPLRTSSRTTSMRSDGGTYQTSVCRVWTWNALMTPGSTSL